MRKLLFYLIALPLLVVSCDHEGQSPTPPAPSAADSVDVALTDVLVFSAMDIIDPELRSAVGKMPDGTLMLSFAGEKASLSLDELTGYDGGAPTRRYCNTPIGYTFDMGPHPARHAGETSFVIPDVIIDLGQRSKGTSIYLSSMPTCLKALKSVRLTEESRIDVTLSVVDPCFTDGVINPLFSVDMRRFFGSREAVDGVLTFDAPLSKKNGWSTTRTFHLTDVALDPDNFDSDGHKLRMDAAIGLGGTVSLSGLTTTEDKAASAPERLQLAVSVVMHDVAVSEITGRFAMASKAVTYPLTMKGISYKGTQLLDFSSAKLTIAAVSVAPVDCDIVTSVDARADRRTVAKAAGLSFDVAAAVHSASESWGTFGKLTSSAMGNLLTKSFDNLVFSSVLSTDENVEATLSVGTETGATVAPLFETPVVPLGGYLIDCRDTIPVPQRFISALKEGGVRVIGEVVNTFPADVSVCLTGYSVDDRELLKVEPGVVRAESSLPVNIEVFNKVGSSIDGLSMFILSVRGAFNDGCRALTDSDAIKAELHYVVQK